MAATVFVIPDDEASLQKFEDKELCIVLHLRTKCLIYLSFIVQSHIAVLYSEKKLVNLVSLR